MDDYKKHLDNLSEIRLMMERASKFISLSGLSGVFAGLFAIIGSIGAFWYIEIFLPEAKSPLFFVSMGLKYSSALLLLLWSAFILCMAVLAGIYFTTRNSKRKNLPLWDHSSKKLLINLAIPLFTGAFFIVFLVFKENYLLILPSSLIFYGLSLVNAGHFTYSDVKYLGYIEIILGFTALSFPDFAMLIWTIGFGLLHIVYGILMYYKYEK
jgi:uncharacterized membrane protein HdeD (DUF308 family)